MTEVKNQYKNAQEECINEHEGKWLVIAGPGTGKTYTVTERIKKMIEKNIEPESILCLTFSDTAAREMRTRIGEEYPIDVFTFHSFCLNIMQENEDEFDLEDFKIITDSHKRSLIGECIDELKSKQKLKAYQNEKGDSYKYIKEILDGIDEIKKNRLSEDDYMYALKNNPLWEPYLKKCEKELEDFNNGIKNGKRVEPIKPVNDARTKVKKAYELWDLYSLYSVKMKESGFIDFNDMIDMVLKKFEDDTSTLIEMVCEKYKYVIVDEYQDTNKAQNEVVFNLAKYCPNVFVVGDDDQIIYTFQGAHLDTIEKFYTKFNNDETGEKVNVRCFDLNYRSTQSILDLSGKLAKLQDTDFCEYMAVKSDVPTSMKNIYKSTPPPKCRLLSKLDLKEGKIEKNLKSAPDSKVKDMDKPVVFTEYHNSDDERDEIVSKIVALKKEFDEYNEKEKELAVTENREPKLKKLSEIAILSRTNSDLNNFSDYLKANGVPVEVTGGKNIFDINSVNVLITYMQFLVNPEKYTDKILSYLLLQPFHIDPRDFKTICGYKSRYDSIVAQVENLVSKCSTEDEFKEKIENIVNNFHKNALIYDIERLTKSEKQIVYKKKELKKFIDNYKFLRNYIACENYKNSILAIGERTGIFHYYFCEDSVNKLENIAGIKKLIETADAYFEVHKDTGNSFSLFVEYLTKLIEGDIEVKLDKSNAPMDAVQLSTYHSSKGREFEYVFMPVMTKIKWESDSHSNKSIIPLPFKEGETYEDLNEQNALAKFLDCIKLIYVGMTRAKHTLYLSYTKGNDPRAGKLTRFVNLLVEDKDINEQRDILQIKNVEKYDISKDYSEPSYEYDKSEIKDFCDYVPNTFSPSAINTYKDCPKQYFYKYILGLNSESSIDNSASFGTAMHAAFEFAIKQVMTNKKYPDYDEVYGVFKEKLGELETENIKDLLENAKNKLFSKGGYYDKFKELVDPKDISDDKYEEKPEINSKAEGKYKIYAEYPISTEIEIPKDWDIKVNKDKKIVLKGFIDRLDKTPEGEFQIYDYKSRETCDSISPSDNYFYQMVLYKYIFENKIENAKVTKACFLLPLEKNGKTTHDLLSKIESIPKNEDKSNYDKIIDKTFECIKGVYNLDFDVPQKPNCTFCGLKQFCSSKTI